MAIDWAAARLDYVTHHELTYQDIAEKYHAYPSTIWKRAAQEAWTEQRKTAGKKLEEKAREKAVLSQSEELARCNASHLELTRKLEAAVKQRLECADKLTDNGLRCVSAVAEAAQRIARLALGVSIENLRTSHDPYAQMSDAELAAELQRLGIEPTEPQ